MALIQMNWGRVLEVAIMPLILAILGFWSGWRTQSAQSRREQRQGDAAVIESSDNRALREAERISKEWDGIKEWWTAELHGARMAEDECVKKFTVMERWSLRLASKWNAHHPDDPMDLPNGGKL
jgi:phosphoribosylformylglycinamidine (FGAM) synthase-like enzyme